MATDCPQLGNLHNWALDGPKDTVLKDPGISSIVSQQRGYDSVEHKTLKRKHRKRHKKHGKRDNKKLSKRDIIKIWSETCELTDDNEVLLDGFGNDIKERQLLKSCGDCAKSKIVDQFKEQEDEDEFAWIYSDVSEGNKKVQGGCSRDLTLQHCLSQKEEPVRWSEEPEDGSFECLESERLAIEEEIRHKCKEMEKLLDMINSKNLRRSKRHRTTKNGEGEAQPVIVNIEPIIRQKRTAQPIRNALLMRSSIKKAWKGSLGSCCGKGCWAKWKWVNLKKVMSDYS